MNFLFVNGGNQEVRKIKPQKAPDASKAKVNMYSGAVIKALTTLTVLCDTIMRENG